MSVNDRNGRRAEAAWQHARGCKKPPQECRACQDNIEWFGELALPELSRVLSE